MNLEIIDCEQGTPEWLTARAGLLTASTVGGLLTPKGGRSTGKTADTLLRRLGRERNTVRTYPIPDTWAMRRGRELEPHARAEYAMEHTRQPVTETGLIVATFDDGSQLGYSPDGLVGHDGLLEIKCPNIDRYTQVVLDDAPLDEHMAQLQAGLLVTGRDWIDYMVFHPGEVSHIVRVHPDEHWQTALKDIADYAQERIEHYAWLFDQRTGNGTPSPAELETDY